MVSGATAVTFTEPSGEPTSTRPLSSRLRSTALTAPMASGLLTVPPACRVGSRRGTAPAPVSRPAVGAGGSVPAGDWPARPGGRCGRAPPALPPPRPAGAPAGQRRPGGPGRAEREGAGSPSRCPARSGPRRREGYSEPAHQGGRRGERTPGAARCCRPPPHEARRDGPAVGWPGPEREVAPRPSAPAGPAPLGAVLPERGAVRAPARCSSPPRSGARPAPPRPLRRPRPPTARSARTTPASGAAPRDPLRRPVRPCGPGSRSRRTLPDELEVGAPAPLTEGEHLPLGPAVRPRQLVDLAQEAAAVGNELRPQKAR